MPGKDLTQGEDIEGLDPRLQSRILSLIGASGGRVWLVSGFRSEERQAALWRDAVAKYGSESAARKWVAPPGKSNHNRGQAVDIGGTDEGMAWARQNLARYGLWQPMSHEPWHFEVLDTAVDFDPEAYTTPPIGQAPAGDPHDPGFQFARMIGMLDRDMTGGFTDAPGDGIMAPAGGEIDIDEGAGVVLDSGAAMQDFGFRDDPDRMQQQLEETLDV